MRELSTLKKDILGITESWHVDSSCVCIARMRSLDYNVIEVARPIPDEAPLDSIEYTNHGGVVIITRSGLRLNKIESLGCYSKVEYVCGRITVLGVLITILLLYRPGSHPLTAKF